MSIKTIHQNLLDALFTAGLLEYGQFISGELVREILGVTMPKMGTRKQFQEAALKEMAAVDYVRNHLLGEGKYIASIGDNYRILLPSENQGKISSYMKSADNKLRRALKLNKSTPTMFKAVDNTNVRISMKRSEISNGLRGISVK